MKMTRLSTALPTSPTQKSSHRGSKGRSKSLGTRIQAWKLENCRSREVVEQGAPVSSPTGLSWKSILQYKENRIISWSGCLREKVVIKWKLLEVCNVGNNSQNGRYQYIVRKKLLKSIGYLLNLSATYIQQQYHRECEFVVFLQGNTVYPYCLHLYIQRIHLLAYIICLHTWVYDNLL